jgi:hypothetical protein
VLELWALATWLLLQPAAGSAASCAAIEEDAGRLACYDALFRKNAASERPQTGGQNRPATVDRPAPPPSARGSMESRGPMEEFGLTPAQREARARAERTEPALESIEARIESTSVSASGRQVLKLDNGQTWMQIESSRRQRFQPGDTIRIRAAALGSFLASGPRSGGTARIRRVE